MAQVLTAIEWQVEEFQERLGMKCDVNIECEEIEQVLIRLES